MVLGTIKGLKLGELILKPDQLVITAIKEAELKLHDPIAWDINLLSMDGFDGAGYYSIDLKPIYTIHRTYELIRSNIQHLPQKTRKRLDRKYRRREKNRVKDQLHKISKRLADKSHIFEYLSGIKDRVARTKSKARNRQNSKHNYRMLQKYVEYKSAWNCLMTIYVDPKNTSKTCSKCGFTSKDPSRSRTFKCKRCGLVMNRQQNAARNIWNAFLKMKGVGFPLNGAKLYDKPAMNPEQVEGGEAQGLSSIRINT